MIELLVLGSLLGFVALITLILSPKFRKDKDAKVTPGAAIGLAIAIIVLASILPSAMDEFYAADTANWTIDGAEDTKTTTLWYLIPVLIVVALLMKFYVGRG